MLSTRMQQEKDVNERIISTRQSEVVSYGSEIQLMHLDSGAYLQMSKQPAELQRECRKLELSLDPSPNRVIFAIVPRYKYRQEGDKVVYGDHILFKNMNKHMFIHYEKILPIEENRTLPSTYRPQCPYRRI